MPKDLSQMSDEEIAQIPPEERAIIAQGGISPWTMTDEELKAYRVTGNPDYKPQYREEYHPALSEERRAFFKLTANSPEAQARAIERELPGATTEIKGGNVYYTPEGEIDKFAFDPQMSLSKQLTSLKGLDELQRDFRDLPGDVLSGLATGIASGTGGALAGPVGAIAAGGATSGALEALRQKLGQTDVGPLGRLGTQFSPEEWGKGVPQEVNLGDVATASTIGALVPAGSKTIGALKNKISPLIPKAFEMVGRATGIPGFGWLGKTLGSKVKPSAQATKEIAEDMVYGGIGKGMVPLVTKEEIKQIPSQSRGWFLEGMKTAKEGFKQEIKDQAAVLPEFAKERYIENRSEAKKQSPWLNWAK